MAFTSGGKVTFTDKGTYDDTVTYRRLDYVKYNGDIYVCKKTSQGNLPNATVDTEYWTKFLSGSGFSLYIYDSGSNTTPQRNGLQFMNGTVTDDPVLLRTKVTIGITDTEWTQIQILLGTTTP